MYFVDLVKKSFFGYQWLGGGGHANHDSARPGEAFSFSAKLLNENQNMTPTVFGILSDEEISNVTVNTSEALSDATIFNGRDAGERLFAVQLQNDDLNEQHFVFAITYKDGSKVNYAVPDAEKTGFHQGRPVYFYTPKTLAERQITGARPFPQHTAYIQGAIKPAAIILGSIQPKTKQPVKKWRAVFW